MNELQEKDLLEHLKESLKENPGGISKKVPGAIREGNHRRISGGTTREILELTSVISPNGASGRIAE